MNKPFRPAAPKKATNVTLPVDMVEDAKRLGINVSQACEAGLANEVRKALGEEWRRENREAIESWNDWVAENGLPLARYRLF